MKKLKSLEALLDNYNKKLDEMETKINNLTIKIEELEAKINGLNGLNNSDNAPKEDKGNNFNEDLEKLKKALEELKQAHDQTVIKVTNNKEQIDLILERLNEINNGYKTGDEKLQKEIDELNKKINQINSQIDLLLKLPRGTDNNKNANSDMDLSAINELMKRILNLESDYKAFVERVNIDEIYRQLKFLHETKADKKELKEKYDDHQMQIDAINKRLDGLFAQMLSRKNEGSDQPVIDIDFSLYLPKSEFDKYKRDTTLEFKKIWDEIKNIKDLINKISSLLNNKANLSDLEDLKNLILAKLEELALACNKKFADRNETANNLKYLEDQIRKLFELLSSSKKDTFNEADNWLLAKKPISGYSCAACESVIGNLRDDANKFIPWNKLPLRDPGDKLYRMGNGFSKMLQMLNFDNYGNVSLNPNIINEANFYNNVNINNNNINNSINNSGQNNNNNTLLSNQKGKTDIKKRVQSANPKIKLNFQENKLKNKNPGNKEINDATNANGKTKDDLLPDIYDMSGTQNSEGPKITKVVKKTFHKQENKKKWKLILIIQINSIFIFLSILIHNLN